MGMAVGGNKSKVTSDINVTPMADVMLVLLIIFMITTPLLQEGVFVNKARARNAEASEEANAENATVVSITRTQEIFVDQTLVPEDQLAEKISEKVALAPELPLFIKSDVAALYGKVVDVVNMARDAGAERIGLLVDRESEEGR